MNTSRDEHCANTSFSSNSGTCDGENSPQQMGLAHSPHHTETPQQMVPHQTSEEDCETPPDDTKAECEMCGKRFLSWKHLFHHEAMVHGETSDEDAESGSGADSVKENREKSNKRRESRDSSSGSKKQCKTCGKEYFSWVYFRHDETTIHNKTTDMSEDAESGEDSVSGSSNNSRRRVRREIRSSSSGSESSDEAENNSEKISELKSKAIEPEVAQEEENEVPNTPDSSVNYHPDELNVESPRICTDTRNLSARESHGERGPSRGTEDSSANPVQLWCSIELRRESTRIDYQPETGNDQASDEFSSEGEVDVLRGVDGANDDQSEKNNSSVESSSDRSPPDKGPHQDPPSGSDAVMASDSNLAWEDLSDPEHSRDIHSQVNAIISGLESGDENEMSSDAVEHTAKNPSEVNPARDDTSDVHQPNVKEADSQLAVEMDETPVCEQESEGQSQSSLFQSSDSAAVVNKERSGETGIDCCQSQRDSPVVSAMEHNEQRKGTSDELKAEEMVREVLLPSVSLNPRKMICLRNILAGRRRSHRKERQKSTSSQQQSRQDKQFLDNTEHSNDKANDDSSNENTTRKPAARGNLHRPTTGLLSLLMMARTESTDHITEQEDDNGPKTEDSALSQSQQDASIQSCEKQRQTAEASGNSDPVAMESNAGPLDLSTTRRDAPGSQHLNEGNHFAKNEDVAVEGQENTVPKSCEDDADVTEDQNKKHEEFEQTGDGCQPLDLSVRGAPSLLREMTTLSSSGDTDVQNGTRRDAMLTNYRHQGVRESSSKGGSVPESGRAVHRTTDAAMDNIDAGRAECSVATTHLRVDNETDRDKNETGGECVFHFPTSKGIDSSGGNNSVTFREERFSCNLCAAVFHTERGLNWHLQVTHVWQSLSASQLVGQKRKFVEPPLAMGEREKVQETTRVEISEKLCEDRIEEKRASATAQHEERKMQGSNAQEYDQEILEAPEERAQAQGPDSEKNERWKTSAEENKARGDHEEDCESSVQDAQDEDPNNTDKDDDLPSTLNADASIESQSDMWLYGEDTLPFEPSVDDDIAPQSPEEGVCARTERGQDAQDDESQIQESAKPRMEETEEMKTSEEDAQTAKPNDSQFPSAEDVERPSTNRNVCLYDEDTLPFEPSGEAPLQGDERDSSRTESYHLSDSFACLRDVEDTEHDQSRKNIPVAQETQDVSTSTLETSFNQNTTVPDKNETPSFLDIPDSSSEDNVRDLSRMSTAGRGAQDHSFSKRQIASVQKDESSLPEDVWNSTTEETGERLFLEGNKDESTPVHDKEHKTPDSECRHRGDTRLWCEMCWRDFVAVRLYNAHKERCPFFLPERKSSRSRSSDSSAERKILGSSLDDFEPSSVAWQKRRSQQKSTKSRAKSTMRQKSSSESGANNSTTTMSSSTISVECESCGEQRADAEQLRIHTMLQHGVVRVEKLDQNSATSETNTSKETASKDEENETADSSSCEICKLAARAKCHVTENPVEADNGSNSATGKFTFRKESRLEDNGENCGDTGNAGAPAIKVIQANDLRIKRENLGSCEEILPPESSGRVILGPEAEKSDTKNTGGEVGNIPGQIFIPTEENSSVVTGATCQDDAVNRGCEIQGDLDMLLRPDVNVDVTLSNTQDIDTSAQCRLNDGAQALPLLTVCTLCEESFQSGDDFISHALTLHNGLVQGNTRDTNSAKKRATTTAGASVCKTCFCKFRTVARLTRHLSTEEGQKACIAIKNGTYKCHACEMKFLTDTGLRLHLKKCSSVWRCSICVTPFYFKADLINHLRIKHTRTEAKKQYPDRVPRLQHKSLKKANTQEYVAEYPQCRICAKQFLSEVSLMSHMESSHRDAQNSNEGPTVQSVEHGATGERVATTPGPAPASDEPPRPDNDQEDFLPDAKQHTSGKKQLEKAIAVQKETRKEMKRRKKLINNLLQECQAKDRVLLRATRISYEQEIRDEIEKQRAKQEQRLQDPVAPVTRNVTGSLPLVQGGYPVCYPGTSGTSCAETVTNATKAKASLDSESDVEILECEEAQSAKEVSHSDAYKEKIAALRAVHEQKSRAQKEYKIVSGVRLEVDAEGGLRGTIADKLLLLTRGAVVPVRPAAEQSADSALEVDLTIDDDDDDEEEMKQE